MPYSINAATPKAAAKAKYTSGATARPIYGTNESMAPGVLTIDIFFDDSAGFSVAPICTGERIRAI